MNDCRISKNAWSPGRSMRSVKLCGCGLQRSPEIALIASTSSEPCRYRNSFTMATMSFSRTPGLSFSCTRIGPVDHRGGAIEQRDLVRRLDLARLEHNLLAVGDLEARLLQLEHHRRLDDVDADG